MVKYSATLRVSGSFRPVLVPLPFPSCPLSFPVSCFVFGCTGLLTNEPHGGIFQAGIGAPLTLAEICLPARLLQIRCAGQLRAGRSAGRVRASASLVRGGLSRQPVHVLCMSAWLPTTSIASQLCCATPLLNCPTAVCLGSLHLLSASALQCRRPIVIANLAVSAAPCCAVLRSAG